jgi:hypothetical protein
VEQLDDFDTQYDLVFWRIVEIGAELMVLLLM